MSCDSTDVAGRPRVTDTAIMVAMAECPPGDPLEGHRLISRRVRLPVHHVFAKDVLGINLYALQAVVAANAESINSTYFIPGNLFARPRSQPSACRK